MTEKHTSPGPSNLAYRIVTRESKHGTTVWCGAPRSWETKGGRPLGIPCESYRLNIEALTPVMSPSIQT
jgi:hypothetical protein